jgi:hypothetical protein
VSSHSQEDGVLVVKVSRWARIGVPTPCSELVERRSRLTREVLVVIVSAREGRETLTGDSAGARGDSQ